MARKTNKTDHVLGLLAGKSEETNAANNERKAAVKNAKSDAPAGSNVQVVAKQEEDDAIADTVKQLLEEELETEGDSMPEISESIFDDEEEMEALRAAEEEAKEIFEEERRAAEEAKKAAEEAEEAAEEEAAKEAAEEEVLKTAQEEAQKSEEKKNEKTADKEYVFLNVMETLVREKVDVYMDQFATCHCSRCRSDIIALTLTSLPSKYVVISKNAATPLMNFYSQRYAGAITVEATKACTRVKEHPHHGRE